MLRHPAGGPGAGFARSRARIVDRHRLRATAPWRGGLPRPFASDDPVFPSDAAFDAFYDRECVAAFRSFTGDDYADRDDVEMQWIVPSVDGWQAGDRLVMCYLTPADGQAVARSYRRPGWAPTATSSP